MSHSRIEILRHFDVWLESWNCHDLAGVMEFMHEDVVFENWNGIVINGKSALQRAWTPWFLHHHNFRFIKEDVFLDDHERKMTFMWRLEWPSINKKYFGKPEVRRGLDVLYFQDGRITRKCTYSKTSIQIDSVNVDLEMA